MLPWIPPNSLEWRLNGATMRALHALAHGMVPLLFRSIEDRRRGIHDFEIRGHRQQGRIRLISHDVSKAERLFPHAGVAPFAVNHRLEIGRSPHFGNNGYGPIISDLTRGYRVRHSYA